MGYSLCGYCKRREFRYGQCWQHYYNVLSETDLIKKLLKKDEHIKTILAKQNEEIAKKNYDKKKLMNLHLEYEKAKKDFDAIEKEVRLEQEKLVWSETTKRRKEYYN